MSHKKTLRIFKKKNPQMRAFKKGSKKMSQNGYTLRKYQAEGVKWMIEQEFN